MQSDGLQISNHMKQSTLISISLLALLFLAGCLDVEDAKTTTDESTAVETVENTPAEAPASNPDPNLEVPRLTGEYFAFTAQLSTLEFTEEELDAIAEGFRRGLSTQTSQDEMQAKFGRVSDYLRIKHDEKAKKDAAKNKQAAAEFVKTLEADPDVTILESGLAYTIIDPGEDKKIDSSNAVSINYRGSLIDGTVFDEAMDPEQPVTFPINGVIKGFADGLKLVGNGGKIKLYIPSELGYGDNPRPGSLIEPGAMLVFDIDVIDVISPNPGGAPGNTPPPPPPPSGE
jgi:FKBP-type peptidyl-prolyl cis-trans isomerase